MSNGRTTTEAWRRHGPTEHGRTVAWRRTTEVLWTESKSTGRGSAAALVRRSDLVDDTLRLVMPECYDAI